jgi:hypothetical protein
VIGSILLIQNVINTVGHIVASQPAPTEGASAGADGAGAGAGATPSATGEVPTCTANDLKVELYTKQDAFNYDQGLHVFVRSTYLGQTSCVVETSPQDRYMLIKFGNNDFYNSATCPAPESGLLFSKGDANEKELTWSLRATGADGCATGDLAPEGYYTVQLLFASSPGLSSNPVTFRIG